MHWEDPLSVPSLRKPQICDFVKKPRSLRAWLDVRCQHGMKNRRSPHRRTDDQYNTEYFHISHYTNLRSTKDLEGLLVSVSRFGSFRYAQPSYFWSGFSAVESFPVLKSSHLGIHSQPSHSSIRDETNSVVSREISFMHCFLGQEGIYPAKP